VKRLFQLIGIMLTVLWLPITAHCCLEKVPGLQFLKCATDTPDNGPCQDECSQLETATYKISDTHTHVLPPAFTVFFQILVQELRADEQRKPVIKTSPEIPTGWQFSLRTALLPRAPSFTS